MLESAPAPLSRESTLGGAVTRLIEAQQLCFPLAANCIFIHLYIEFLYYPDKGLSLTLSFFVLV